MPTLLHAARRRNWFADVMAACAIERAGVQVGGGSARSELVDYGRETPPVAWWASGRVRLPLLLGCLGVLVVYVLVARTSVLRASSAVAECPSESAPHVVGATAADLSGLRASVARVMPGRIGRLYEEGTIEASNAWSDNSPSPPPLSPTAPRPAGYEMRWWAPNGDDVVA